MKKIFYKIKDMFFNKNFIVFVIIGIINTIVYNGIYLLSLNIIHYIIASILAYFISMSVSFILNCKYNFKIKPTIKKYIMFPLSGIPTFFMQTVGLTFFVEVLNISEKIAGFTASLIAIPFSFIIMKLILKK